MIAHRGASADHPENTLEAFVAARAAGAHAVELDVRRTADGVLVVHHDAHLPEGPALVALAAAELPAHVPTLRDALEACRGMGVNVEVKNLPFEDDFDPGESVATGVVALLEGLAEPPPVLVSSFHPPTVACVHELEPTLPTALLTFDPDWEAGVRLAVAAGHRALHPYDPHVTAELVAGATAAGLEVNTWTVDEPERMRELAQLGVHGIVTNVPALAREVLG